jgi:tripartite ATP-independent transporter DctP family solute receptor
MLGADEEETSLEKVIQFSPEELPDIPEFINRWIEYLGEKDGREADRMILDAISMIGDLETARSYAHRYSDVHPGLYARVLHSFQDTDPNTLASVGLEAMDVIPKSYQERSEIALDAASCLIRGNSGTADQLDAGFMAAMLAAAMTMSFSAAAYADETEGATEAAASGEFSADDVKNASNEQPEIPDGAEVLKLGTTVNENDSFQIAAVKFAQLIQDKTDGKYAIEIHPNGDLGGERDMLESMQMDTLDMGIVTSGPFVNFSADMGVLDMPFLFASNAQAYAVFDGEVGRELLDTLEDSNLKGLAYAERGFRNLTNSKKAVHSADDVKGLKIRVMENDVYTAAFKALGADAVPMNWNDTLTALQQGTVDGEENPINVINSYKLWESQKYCTLDRHSYSSAIITMSLDKFNELDADTQQIFLDSAQEAAEFERAWVAAQEADQLQTMKDNGMEVDEDPDMDSFKEAVQSVYDDYSQYADYVEKINEVIKDVQ